MFPELCICGYPPQDLIERPAFVEWNQKELACLAQEIPLPSDVGFVWLSQDDIGKPVANSAAVIQVEKGKQVTQPTSVYVLVLP